jgi:hypothetical protein
MLLPDRDRRLKATWYTNKKNKTKNKETSRIGHVTESELRMCVCLLFSCICLFRVEEEKKKKERRKRRRRRRLKKEFFKRRRRRRSGGHLFENGQLPGPHNLICAAGWAGSALLYGCRCRCSWLMLFSSCCCCW